MNGDDYNQHEAHDPLSNYNPDSCGQLKDQTSTSDTLLMLAIGLGLIFPCAGLVMAAGLVI